MNLHLLERAIALAAIAHEGQLDGAGVPYIFHPLQVMLSLKDKEGIEVETLAAAVLHDVVEDTTFTLEDIQNQFGDKVATLVNALSRRQDCIFCSIEGCQYPFNEEIHANPIAVKHTWLPAEGEEPYNVFIKRVILAGNEAMLIKEADMMHNFGRLNTIKDDAKRARLANKYKNAFVQLWRAQGIGTEAQTFVGREPGG